MSQSDYLKYLRVSTQLSLDASKNQLPVFDPSKYLNFKEYVLQNTIKDASSVTYNLIRSSGEVLIFDIERNPINCPTTYECINTNKRSNRIPMPGVYFTPTAQPLNWKQKKHALWKKNGCVCQLNSINTLRNICNCKTKV
jgi:hypothetical protein